MTSDATTEGIRIEVRPAYWADKSQPENQQYAFTYTVKISNVGTESALLKARHWLITDANGRTEEVKGEGVVGKQPQLKPGESFEYTSWAMLKTPHGAMRGTYLMVRPDGTTFKATIAEFGLALPNALN